MFMKLNNLVYGKTDCSKSFLWILCAVFIAISSPVFPQNSNKSVVQTETKDLPRFLLQVGINKYKYARQLKGAENDIKDLHDVLQKRFSTERQKWQTVQLVDEQATHAAIERAFKTHLIENARKNPGAIVVFHYSGHGSQITDVNGDETDGRDETLVPIDSRDPQKKGFDITDDKLNEWFQVLSRYTSNITFILDSCHSGTGTRSNDATRNVEMDAGMQSKQNGVNNSEAKSQSDFPNADVLRANNNYVTISAALAGETASEIQVTQGATIKHYGALTYYLVEALKYAAPETTYRQLMERVSVAVSQRKPQNPQAEGDIGKAVFGGTASTEEPFIKIKQIDGKKIIIEAGEAQGVKKGAPLAIYSPDRKEAPILKGEKGKLAIATVTKVYALTAEAEVSGENDKITKEARVKLVAPNFGFEPLKVLDDAASPDKSSSLPEDLSEQLSEKNLAKIVRIGQTEKSGVPKNDGNLLTIKRSPFGKAFGGANLKSGETQKQISETEEIFYLDQNADEKPDFGFFVKTNDAQAAETLADALEKIAVQHNLRSLSNNAAPPEIAGKIKLTVLAVEVIKEGEKVKDIASVKELPSNTTDYSFDQNSYFQIKIENTSKIPLYVTLFDLSANGKIEIMYPPESAREALDSGKSIVSPIYVTTAPAGSETIKAVAVTSYADFRVLTQTEIAQRSAASAPSPIGWLMKKAFGKPTRGLIEEPNLDSWTTTSINFRIGEKIKK